MRKNILHLCADLGSDSWYYQQDEKYNVICIGEAIGVENYTPDFPVHGIIANPANGRLKEFLGKPDMVYQPWEFNKPNKIYSRWEDVPKLDLSPRVRDKQNTRVPQV